MSPIFVYKNHIDLHSFEDNLKKIFIVTTADSHLIACLKSANDCFASVGPYYAVHNQPFPLSLKSVKTTQWIED